LSVSSFLDLSDPESSHRFAAANRGRDVRGAVI